MKASYSFAFEIYTDPSADADLKSRWEEKMQETHDTAFLQENNLAHSKFKDLFEKHPSCFVQTASEKHHHRGFGDMSPEDCFAQFNPANEEEYNSVVENWSAAYLDMAEMVVKNLKGGAQASAASAAPAAPDAAPAASEAAPAASSGTDVLAAFEAPPAASAPSTAADPTANAISKNATKMGLMDYEHYFDTWNGA